jgi:hypothetical protein
MSSRGEEEPLLCPRLITISGVVDVVEELVPDGLPRLMMISSMPEPVEVGATTGWAIRVMGWTTGGTTGGTSGGTTGWTTGAGPTAGEPGNAL